MSETAEEMPCYQTPVASRWLLLEHPGPWEHTVTAGSAAVPDDIVTAARSHDVRINLVRRRHWLRRTGPRRSFLVNSGERRPFIEQWNKQDLLPELPRALDALAADQPSGGGAAVAEPLYLVCTNGRRNPSCERRGRPVLRALAGLVGDRAWETTHVGGCRFAVNLVCLPSGVYYSQVTPDDLPSIVAATEQGRLWMPRYRGRAGVRPPLQAAEIAVRRFLGLDALAAVTVLGAEGRSAGETVVRLRAGARTYETVVRRRPDGWLGYQVGDVIER